MRDRLIHTLRLARGDWYRYRDKTSLEEALADTILAEFAVMEKGSYIRLVTEVATGRVDKHIKECEKR